MLMHSKVRLGGKSPGTSGAHDASVLVHNMAVHVGNIGEEFMAVWAAVDAGDVDVKFGLCGK